jgi:cell division protein FtsB
MNLKKIINISPKRRNQIITGLIISVFIVLFLFSDYGIIKRISVNMKVSELEELIEEENIMKDSLENRIDKLKKDTFLIEKTAREKYGMIKPGESVILIEE